VQWRERESHRELVVLESVACGLAKVQNILIESSCRRMHRYGSGQRDLDAGVPLDCLRSWLGYTKPVSLGELPGHDDSAVGEVAFELDDSHASSL